MQVRLPLLLLPFSLPILVLVTYGPVSPGAPAIVNGVECRWALLCARARAQRRPRWCWLVHVAELLPSLTADTSHTARTHTHLATNLWCAPAAQARDLPLSNMCPTSACAYNLVGEQSYGLELPKAKLLRLLRLGRVVRLFTALKDLQKILNAVSYAMSLPLRSLCLAVSVARASARASPWRG